MARDKASLDIFWIRDESLEETANLPEPEVLAAQIVETLVHPLRGPEGEMAQPSFGGCRCAYRTPPYMRLRKKYLESALEQFRVIAEDLGIGWGAAVAREEGIDRLP